jgi:hypothetical protein
MRRMAMFAAVAAGVLCSAPAAWADGASLVRGSGQKPGPALLYAPPVQAPQLSNAGDWTAEPILVSGATAYRGGEFLYQDFLYDDHGARAQPDPADPRGAGDLFSKPNGTVTYPTLPGYAGNAADLVELRVKPTADATAFRLTLNTMVDPELVGATIAIGTSDGPRALPHGANVSAPAQLFLTWHGNAAELVDAATGAVLSPAPWARVDEARRQVDLRIPHAAWDPGRSTVRLAAGVGLWDQARDQYLVPGASATETTPGGAGGLDRPAAFFNVAFRGAEPYASLDASALLDPAWWRDRLQGHALAGNGFGELHADVDFAKLADGVTDESGVPRTGVLNRILSSRFAFGEGVDWRDTCFPKVACTGELRGALQPYAIYVPERAARGGRYQLTLLLHSLTANYNQFSGSRNQREFGQRSRPSIVITPAGRGPDGFYDDIAGADTFEVWADVARRYRLDPDRTTVAGYSMGGFGSVKFVTQYPDLFARAQPTVGALVGNPDRLASARWVPFLLWNATRDELVPPASYTRVSNALRRFGYRYELDQFAPAVPPPPTPTPQHVLLSVNDQYAPAARFLGDAKVVRNPPRVTFAYQPSLDFPRAQTTADHAYWLSNVHLRRAGGDAIGTIDVRSHGFGVGSPSPRRSSGRGTLTGGTFGPRPFTVQRTTWGRAPRTARRDRLTIRATNVASVTIDARRARVSCRARLSVRSDGPLRVRLANCPPRP